MTAPDKIFLNRRHPEPYWFKDKQVDSDIEYIRKDALIELLKPEKDISFPDDYERGCIDGRNGLREELIYKLNSM